MRSCIGQVVWKFENFMQKGAVWLMIICSLSTALRYKRYRTLLLNALNNGLERFLRILVRSPGKCSNKPVDVPISTYDSTYAAQEASTALQESNSLGVMRHHNNDTDDVPGEGAFALGTVSEEKNETEMASDMLSLKFLLLSGEMLFLQNAAQSWTGSQLKVAALNQMPPAMFPQSLISSKGEIYGSQMVKTYGLMTGDVLHVIMGSLAGRYCGTAEARRIDKFLDFDVEEVKYKLSIFDTCKFQLSAGISCRGATLHGKLISGGRFIFDNSELRVRLWLDDVGLVRLSDEGHWDFYGSDCSSDPYQDTVEYHGVEGLQLKPVKNLVWDADSARLIIQASV